MCDAGDFRESVRTSRPAAEAGPSREAIGTGDFASACPNASGSRRAAVILAGLLAGLATAGTSLATTATESGLQLLAQQPAASASPAGSANVPAAGPPPGPTQQFTKQPLDVIQSLSSKAIDWVVDKGPAVVASIAILVVAWILAAWLRRVVIRAIGRTQIDVTLGKFFGNIARWIVLVLAVTVALQTIGIPATTFAAVIGAAGLAIGLALQSNLSNLASGVLLLIFRPFKIGDAVIVAGQSGVVDGIDLFTCNLDTGDNRRIIVPNSAIFGGVIENQTRHPYRRVIVPVSVALTADVDATRALLSRAAAAVVASTKGALAEPAPAVVLDALTPAMAWSVVVTAQTASVLAVKEALLKELKRTIEQANLVPPPPIMQVVMKEPLKT